MLDLFQNEPILFIGFGLIVGLCIGYVLGFVLGFVSGRNTYTT